MGDLDWYVLATRPKGEADAVDDLGRLSFSTFVPRYRETVRRRHRRVWVSRVLFPGYVFVGLSAGLPLQFHALRDLRDVRGVVCFGGCPARLPDDEMFSMQAADLLGAFDLRPVGLAERGFVPDARVRATDGPFVSLCGTIASVTPQDRLVVLFELLGKPAPVEMSLDAVELV